MYSLGVPSTQEVAAGLCFPLCTYFDKKKLENGMLFVLYFCSNGCDQGWPKRREASVHLITFSFDIQSGEKEKALFQ